MSKLLCCPTAQQISNIFKLTILDTAKKHTLLLYLVNVQTVYSVYLCGLTHFSKVKLCTDMTDFLQQNICCNVVFPTVGSAEC